MVSQYRSILKEKNHKRNASYETYYQDPNYGVYLVEFIGHKPFTYEALVNKTFQAKESNQPIISIRDYEEDWFFDMLFEVKKLKLVGKHCIPFYRRD